MLPLFLAVLAAAVFAVIPGTVFLTVFSKRVIFPSPPRTLSAVVAGGRSSIELDASPLTVAPGRYGAWFDGDAHAVVGAVISEDAERGTVTRELLTSPTSISDGTTTVRWSGHVFPAPDALRLPHREVVVDGASGPCPAWLFPGTGEAGVWAIHIHGYNTTRITTLRGVPVASALGFTSLVVSYLGDGEASSVPGAPSMLGTVEHRDVEAAIAFALAGGARSVVLFGWSMGANIALQLAARSRHREHIAGLVLIGPLAGWRWAIEEGAVAARLPRFVGRLVTGFLGTTAGARLAGARAAYPLRHNDWTHDGSTVERPVLILHSPGDLDVPLASSRALAERHPRQVSLAEFDPVPHCMEWNAEPEQFERTVRDWWAARSSG